MLTPDVQSIESAPAAARSELKAALDNYRSYRT